MEIMQSGVRRKDERCGVNDDLVNPPGICPLWEDKK